MRGVHAFVALLMLLVIVLPAHAAELTVQAGLDAEEALLGDTVGFTILVTGTDEVEGPGEDAFGFDFDVISSADGRHAARRSPPSTGERPAPRSSATRSSTSCVRDVPATFACRPSRCARRARSS